MEKYKVYAINKKTLRRSEKVIITANVLGEDGHEHTTVVTLEEYDDEIDVTIEIKAEIQTHEIVAIDAGSYVEEYNK